MSLHHRLQFSRLDLMGAATPLESLPRLSRYLGRDIFIKRDDLSPLALGGNKLRKLEYLAADAVEQRADVLITAGGIQSNHVRQTAAVAARLGMKCVALLENPVNSSADNYLHNGNRLLLSLMDCDVVMADNLNEPYVQLQAQAQRLEAQGFRPYCIPVGGSNALGALGYVACAEEIAMQCQHRFSPAAVVVASGSAGTQAGLAVGLEQLLPDSELTGVTVSRNVEQQLPVVSKLQQEVAQLLETNASAGITLWDEYYYPQYGMPNEAGMEAIKLLARMEGIILDPVYTGKAMAGLIEGIVQHRFQRKGPIIFVHTGGSPALFACHPQV